MWYIRCYSKIHGVGGVEKYYQIATCFRYENGRKDRQLEFKQLDMEMSYITEKNVLFMDNNDRIDHYGCGRGALDHYHLQIGSFLSEYSISQIQLL